MTKFGLGGMVGGIPRCESPHWALTEQGDFSWPGLKLNLKRVYPESPWLLSGIVASEAKESPLRVYRLDGSKAA